jgi:hypothetical protein
MTAFASVFSPRVGCKYRPKKVPRTKAPTMLMVLARLGFVLAFGLIGGVLLGMISPESQSPRLAEAAPSLHQTQDRVVAAKRKTSPEASKRAAKLSIFPQASRNDRLAGNFH